jgi:2-polyprenyl-6-hydroxyphenyl methylase/3-demethylubiquinone-9 3-methyltransferase
MTLRWRIAQWFELRWWQNYLRDKDHVAYGTWKKNYWQNTLAKIGAEINLAQSKTIADLGCGPAGIFIWLKDKTVTALDPLIDTYEEKTGFFKKSDYPNTTFVNSTIEDFKPALKYDLVFCMNAINHVHDIQKAFDKVKAACKEDGTVVISIDAHNYSLFKHFFRAVPGDILHPHQYDLAEYKNMLSSGGWAVKTTVLLKQDFFFGHYLLIAAQTAI